MRFVLVNKAQKFINFRDFEKVTIHAVCVSSITPYYIKKCYIILIALPLILFTDRPKPQLYANCFNFFEPAQAGKNIYQQDSVMN